MERNKMDYRDILGLPKKQPKKKVEKKVAPKPTAPPITELLKEEFGDTINEGPAYEYANQISKIEKLYDVYWDAVKDLGRTLEKKGQRKLSKELYMAYRKQVSKFSQWFSKFSGALM